MQPPAQVSVNADPSPTASPGASLQLTDTVPNLYYSDQDVIILHDIVSLAQHDLDNAHAPKPLPAAALFKAYDEVLPSYGIDPDRDHHISAFVFRIGGEEGEAPLLDKFHAILGQLGITVELGEDQGQDGDVQHSPAPSTTRSVRSIFNRSLRLHSRLALEGHLPGGRAFARIPELVHASQQDAEQSSLASQGWISQNRTRQRMNLDEFAEDSPAIVASMDHVQQESDPRIETSAFDQNNGPPPRLESDLDRWIRAAKAQRENAFGSPAGNAATSALTSALSTSQRPIQSRESQISQRMRDQLARPAHPSPPSLMSLIEGWRSVASRQHRNPESPIQFQSTPSTTTRPAHAPTSQQMYGLTKEHSSAIAGVDRQSQLLDNDDVYKSPNPASTRKEAAAPPGPSQTRQNDIQARAGESLLSQQEMARMHIHQQKLMYRAARARELYLASKFFNHWVDRTARRLEREGVARRHMIRFRYFRGWSRMPSSRDPAMDRLCASAAMQKLQRVAIVKRQELDDLAAYGAKRRHHSYVLRAISIWSSQVATCEAQAIAAERLKARVALRWQMQSATNAAVLLAARLRGRNTRESNALMTWQEQAENHRSQALAARDIGDANRGFSHLRSWWDKSEASRRAAVYRRYLYVDKAAYTFSIWNLAARSQAFKWNNDYKMVSYRFDKWERMAQDVREQEITAQDYQRKNIKDRLLHGLDTAIRDHSRSERVQRRARLFIAATRTLRVFDDVVKRRKADEKDRVKKRLITKYRQASSARKKRHFFTALSHWQARAAQFKACAQLAADARPPFDSHKQMHALDIWVKQTQAHDENMDHAVQHYVVTCLERWAGFAEQDSQREAQAWETWALGRERTALKDWSIMSLQRRGQAHTATVAYHKHVRDRRRRMLQLWKQQADRTKYGKHQDAGLSFTPAPSSLRSHRQSWKLFSDRSRGVSNRSFSMSVTDTPTRWTGQMSPMSSMMGQNPMPAVAEADEHVLTKSTGQGAQGFESPTRARTEDNIFDGLVSTTPMAPVPSHLHGYGPGTGNGARPLPWPRTAHKQRSLYIPSNLGPAAARRIFPRSLQEHPSDEPSRSRKTPATGSSIFPRESQVEVAQLPGMFPLPVPGAATATTAPRSSLSPWPSNQMSSRLVNIDMDKNPAAFEG